jgi:hypothetical protein
MTIHDEILICANQLANAGKKPTVALVKGKMSQRAPLAVLINTLKGWQHQPDFITPIKVEEEQVNQKPAISETSELLESLLKNGSVKKIIQQSLEQELSEMKKELSDMKLLINNLTEQLGKKK